MTVPVSWLMTYCFVPLALPLGCVEAIWLHLPPTQRSLLRWQIIQGKILEMINAKKTSRFAKPPTEDNWLSWRNDGKTASVSVTNKDQSQVRERWEIGENRYKSNVLVRKVAEVAFYGEGIYGSEEDWLADINRFIQKHF